MPQEFPKTAEVAVPLFSLVQPDDEGEVVTRLQNEVCRLPGDYKVTVIKCGALVGFIAHTGSLAKPAPAATIRGSVEDRVRRADVRP
jgi:hypothetical protein